MNMDAYVKEQNTLISRIGVYMFFACLEGFLFALTLKASPELIKKSVALLTPFSMIVGKFVFIADGLINRNIYQITTYTALIFCTGAMFCFAYLKTEGIGSLFNTVAICIVCLDLVYTVFLIRGLRHNYTWYYYKKLGLSEELQMVNKLKQRLNVFFKCNVLLVLTIFGYPSSKSNLVVLFNWFGLFLTFISAFLYTQWLNEDNRPVRILTICITSSRCLLGFVALGVLFTEVIFSSIFIILAVIFSCISDFFFTFYLYKDMQTFGKGYANALKRNVRQSRDALENVS